jgi:tRNA-dihydrouridine synthase B
MLAPLEGVSHPLFRQMMTEFGGLGCVCTEFVRVTNTPLTQAALQREVVFTNDVPLSVQVMGNLAEQMAEAAAAVSALGADVVDINLGCPVPKVVKKGVGAAMLRDLDLLARVLSAMRAAVPGLLSAKIRAGWDDKNHILAIGRTVQAAGADYIVVHPRRRADFYAGIADWRIIAALKAELDIPVVGNGDCWYAADAPRMMAETGCDAVMIGRPALRNPWIFGQIDDLLAGRVPFHPAGDDVVALIDSIIERYRGGFVHDRFVIGKLKEWCSYLIRAAPDPVAARSLVLRPPTVEGVRAGMAAVFAGVAATDVDLDAFGTLGLERSGSAVLAQDDTPPPISYVGPRGQHAP